MKVPFLDLKRQYETIRHQVLASIGSVCDNQSFILGKEVEALENEIADYAGARHAVGVASGSDAILLSLMALDLRQGDGVITTPFTFFATAGSISRLGCKPFFVDIDPRTYNMDPDHLRGFLKTRCMSDERGQLHHRHTGIPIRCVIPVHLFGQCADMDPILDLCRTHGLKVIEDAAQAIGSLYQPDTDHPPRSAGTMGQSGCFSFYPSKNLGAFGDGGMVVCQDEDLADRLLPGRGVQGPPCRVAAHARREPGRQPHLVALLKRHAGPLDVVARCWVCWNRHGNRHGTRSPAGIGGGRMQPIAITP